MKTLKRILLRAVVAVVGLYVILIGLIYFLQRKLFYNNRDPRRIPLSAWASPGFETW